jgi:hypothetical protein
MPNDQKAARRATGHQRGRARATAPASTASADGGAARPRESEAAEREAGSRGEVAQRDGAECRQDTRHA